jgi:hypothetical protein
MNCLEIYMYLLTLQSSTIPTDNYLFAESAVYSNKLTLNGTVGTR